MDEDSDADACTAVEARALETISSWDAWLGLLERPSVPGSVRPAAERALQSCRTFFGEDWLRQMALDGHVPLTSVFPLAAPAQIADLLELGVRLELARSLGLDGHLRQALRLDNSPKMYGHLGLALEVIGFAARAGWHVRLDQPTRAARLPDVTVQRGATVYTIEVTRQMTDRRFNAIERYTALVTQHRWALESAYAVEVWPVSREPLEAAAVETWFAEAVEAASRTAKDGVIRSIEAGANRLYIGPSGSRGISIHDGPGMNDDLGVRLRTRLEEKAKQTVGGPPAWIRLDVHPTLFALTNLAYQSLSEKLQTVAGAVDDWLSGAPHVAGVVISTGARPSRPGSDETVMVPAPVSQLILPAVTERQRQMRIAPVGMLRELPGGRLRGSFILPAHRRAATANELGITAWYDTEKDWLTWALRAARWPSAQL